jgi:hypothetical protein
MKQLLAKAGLAVLIAVSGFVAPLATASAADNGMTVEVQWRGDDRGGPRHHGRGPDRRAGCAPWHAEDKAARMGLRRARVVDMNRRVVVVSGFDRRGRDRIVFANQRGCPVIRR